jgi:hypothetical protein
VHKTKILKTSETVSIMAAKMEAEVVTVFKIPRQKYMGYWRQMSCHCNLGERPAKASITLHRKEGNVSDR